MPRQDRADLVPNGCVLMDRVEESSESAFSRILDPAVSSLKEVKGKEAAAPKSRLLSVNLAEAKAAEAVPQPSKPTFDAGTFVIGKAICCFRMISFGLVPRS